MADQVTTGRFVGRTNEPSAERARVLGSLAQLLVLVAWFAEAREVAENAVTIAGQVGDVAPEVLALVAAGPRVAAAGRPSARPRPAGTPTPRRPRSVVLGVVPVRVVDS
jgi:hypothetical protein